MTHHAMWPLASTRGWSTHVLLNRAVVRSVVAACCALAWMAGLPAASAQDAMAYAPARLRLPDLVDDLVQCDIRLSPQAVLAAFEPYCAAYREALDRVDAPQRIDAPGATEEPSDRLPTTRKVQRFIQLRKSSREVTTALADALLDDLQRSVAPDQVEAFARFRDECHIRLMLDQSGPVGDNYALGIAQDLGGWIRVAEPGTPASPEVRRAIARARLARSAQRRDALREVQQAGEDSQVRLAKRADELGVGGMDWREANTTLQTVQAARDPLGRAPLEALRDLQRVEASARARYAAVQLDAWRAAVPDLPPSMRRYAASTFLEVLSGAGGGAGLTGGLPPTLTGPSYGGGLEVIRLALSLPNLSAAQKQALREASQAWLDARVAEYERMAAVAVRPDFSGTRDGSKMVALDREHRHTLAEIAKTPWLEAEVNAEANASGQPFGRAARDFGPLPTREELVLDPADDALFPLPTGGDVWYASARSPDQTWREREMGLPPAFPARTEEAAVRALASDEGQAVVVRAILADHRAHWSATVQPLIEQSTRNADALRAAQGWEQDPQQRQLLAAQRLEAARTDAQLRVTLWAAPREAWRLLSEQLAAAVAPPKRDAARLFIFDLQLWALLPTWGSERNVPNLAAAATSPWISEQGRATIAHALTTSAESLVELTDRARALRAKADRVDPSWLLAYGADGSIALKADPMVSMKAEAAEAGAVLLARVQQEVDRIAAALEEPDAAAWRRAVLMKRTPGGSVSLDSVMAALDDTPENHAARAAVRSEQERLEVLTDRAAAILQGLPELATLTTAPLRGPVTLLHRRAALYTDLARDMRILALWRLRPQLPAEVVARVPSFRAAAAIDRLNAATGPVAPAASAVPVAPVAPAAPLTR